MEPSEIRRWRPRRFRDFIGASNRRKVDRIRQIFLDDGRLPSPLLLVAPYGYGKTSFARMLFLRLNCMRPDPGTGDPCQSCPECVGFVPTNNGTGTPYQREEIDCTGVGRADILDLCDKYRHDANTAIFLDELHRLHEKHAQEALLKFAEDFPGLLVGAVMADRHRELIPPLRERFETVWLEPPTEDEVVTFLAEKCSGEWRIRAEEPDIRAMVRLSGVSFRFCLKTLAAAAERDSRHLDRGLIDECLGRPPGSHDDGGQPDAEDTGEIEDDERFLE